MCAFFGPVVSVFFKNNLTFPNLKDKKKDIKFKQLTDIIGFLKMVIFGFLIHVSQVRSLPGVPEISRDYAFFAYPFFHYLFKP
jgi:hypothetical protein